MAFLIYKKANGKILQISEVSGAYTEEDTITAVYGPNGVNVFGAIEWDSEFPVGMVVSNGSIVSDPFYIPPPPPPPAPVVEPAPTNPV